MCSWVKKIMKKHDIYTNIDRNWHSLKIRFLPYFPMPDLWRLFIYFSKTFYLWNVIRIILVGLNPNLTPLFMFFLQKVLLINVIKTFWDFFNKFIDIFQWILVSIIPYVANPYFIYWSAMNCLVLIREIWKRFLQCKL